MIRRPPIATRTYTLFPYTTLFRAHERICIGDLGHLVGGPAREDDAADARIAPPRNQEHAVVEPGPKPSDMRLQLRVHRVERGNIGQHDDRKRTVGPIRVSHQERQSTRPNSSPSSATRMPASS